MLLVPSHPSAIYLHVGPPKTGTTYLQQVLWNNRTQLARSGLAIPGARPLDHFHAALDLRSIEFGGYVNPDVAGAWSRLATAAGSTRTPKTVISHEVLAGADESQIARVARDLAPTEVHVVYGARDLARQLPAVWQESLKNRRTRRFERFLDAALEDLDGVAHTSRSGFWKAQDAGAALRRWSAAVPPERIHVMTVPRPGASSATLWERFATCLGVEPTGIDLDVRRSNPSLTREDAEVLRRLNKQLPDELPWPQYERIVKARFNRRADERVTGGAVRVPREYRERVLACAERTREELATAGYAVVGDLDDLIPSDQDFAAPGATAAADPEGVVDAAVALLAAALADRGARPPRLPSGAPSGARAMVGRWSQSRRVRRRQ